MKKMVSACAPPSTCDWNSDRGRQEVGKDESAEEPTQRVEREKKRRAKEERKRERGGREDEHGHAPGEFALRSAPFLSLRPCSGGLEAGGGRERGVPAVLAGQRWGRREGVRGRRGGVGVEAGRG